jgi:NitT/TauT family transport system substrate-binding protein
MRVTTSRRQRERAGIVLAITVVAVVVLLLLAVGTAASAPGKRQAPAADTVTVDTLPIANALPMDLGIKKGFFDAQGIEIKKTVLQSGNDIVLALANHNGDVGYLGYVPMMIARTSGIPLTLVAPSEVEGTSADDNWQNIIVKGSSPIHTAADLAGKSIAVNALKGVGEVIIKAALSKLGVDPNSIKLLAMPFPTMRTALNNGQVDSIWVPEPFLSQGLNLDGDRTVLAPGPTVGKFFPNGGYAALQDWVAKNPGLAKRFYTALNQSLAYAQAHPDEIRAMLPPGTQNVRLPIWSTVVDRRQMLALAKYAKQFGVISTLPNLTQLIPASIAVGLTLQGSVGGKTITLKLDGKAFKTLQPGAYVFVVADRSATQSFHLKGPGVNRTTGVKKTGRSTWTVNLAKGTYTFSSVGWASLKGSFRVG